MSEPLSPEFRAELRESLLGAIQDFFDEQLAPRAEGASAKRPRVTDRQLQLATAVLLLEVARCDFDLRADELNAVSTGVRDILGLTEDEAVAVVRFAEEEVRQSKRIHEFTNLVDRHYTPEQKKNRGPILVASRFRRRAASSERGVSRAEDLRATSRRESGFPRRENHSARRLSLVGKNLRLPARRARLGVRRTRCS